jgi:hypothetical protein
MKKSTKVEGNVIGRVGERGDEGKAKPEGGSSKIGSKWGWIPAAAGGKGKHHEMGHANDGDMSGVLETGKGNRHGHAYGRHEQDTRKIDTLKDGQNK